MLSNSKEGANGLFTVRRATWYKNIRGLVLSPSLWLLSGTHAGELHGVPEAAEPRGSGHGPGAGELLPEEAAGGEEEPERGEHLHYTQDTATHRHAHIQDTPTDTPKQTRPQTRHAHTQTRPHTDTPIDEPTHKTRPQTRPHTQTRPHSEDSFAFCLLISSCGTSIE